MGRRFLSPGPSFADNRLMSDGRLRYRRGLPPFPRTTFPALISRLSYSNLKLAKAISEPPRIEAALRLSEKHFRQLTRPSPVPFAIINLRGESVSDPYFIFKVFVSAGEGNYNTGKDRRGV
jgi:hypothetical protein